ncbi:MAG: lactate utilization protein [Clostridia bacterium]|nr:lactate utilization protein [Clostridia bacterium]
MNFDTIKKNLERRGYTVSIFETKEAAVEYLSERMAGVSVGIGGSMTVEEMGLYPALAFHNKVFWHQHAPVGMTAEEVRRAAAGAKVYISSVNALAESGEVINIDGYGNRVASTIYGHEEVYLVVGSNKIRASYDEALERARNIAAPKNAKRLGKATPCAKLGDRCYDCKSPERICRALSVFWEKPTSSKMEIVLIDEELGY